MNINKMKIVSTLLVIFSLIFIFQFNLNTVMAQDSDMKIAVAVSPIENFVKEIGGKKVNTVVMIPPGYSPANHAPGPEQMIKLSDAEIYFSFGMPAEKTNIIPKLKSFNKDIKTVRLDYLVSEKYAKRKFDNGGIDPHIWLSTDRVKYMIEIIRDKLIKLDPDNKSYYQKRYKKYNSKIIEMDNYVENKMKKLKNKTIIIYHPVLGYFTDEYGLDMMAIEKNGKKATPKRLESIIDFAKNNSVKAIFHQKTIDSKQTKVVADEIGAKLIKINPLSENYIKSMKNIADIIFKYYN